MHITKTTIKILSLAFSIIQPIKMSSSQNKRVLALMRLPENCLCADCHAKDPRWASSKLGVFICINCSGIHRGLGTHITFVRSCTLDTWKPEEVDVMERVGNKKGNEYWEAKLPPDFERPRSENIEAMSKFIRQKYEYKKWIDPMMRPPQLPENVHWEPEPPKSYTNMADDQNGQAVSEAPRRRKKKKNLNSSEEPFINDYNNNESNRNPELNSFGQSIEFTEAKNKMKNNRKKYPKENLSLEHENDELPSSDSLMKSSQQYNDDNGFDPFSGKPLSKEKNFNPDEETDESDPTFADKLIGFIQNGIDFIKEKTKSKKKANVNIPSSSGKMSENPRIPKQDNFDSLQPQNSNRPRFNSFEQQQQDQFHHQPQAFHHQPQAFQQQPPQQPPPFQQQFDGNQNQHNDIGKRLANQGQQQPSADVFSLLSGSEVIIDNSQTDISQEVGQSNSQQQQQSNPFIKEIENQDSNHYSKSLIDSNTNVAEGVNKNGFNPFTNQLASGDSGNDLVEISNDNLSNDQNDAIDSNGLIEISSNEQKDANNSNDLIGLDFTQPETTQAANTTQPSNNNDDLLGLDLNVTQNQQQQQQGYASDLFGLDVSAPNQNEKQQEGSNNSVNSASNVQMKTPSAYDVFGRPNSGISSIGSGANFGNQMGIGSIGSGMNFGNQPGISNNTTFRNQQGIGSLGLSPQQQQIAARAVLAHQGQQRSSIQLSPYSSGASTNSFNSGLGQTGSTNSFTNFNTTNNPSSNLNAKSNKKGSENLDPFSGMNPF